MGGWVVGRGSWVVCRVSLVCDNKSCFVDGGSSRRLLLVEFKGTVFLFTTLHIHVKVSPINFSKAKLSAKYVLPAGPLPCSRMLLAHSAFLLKCTCVQGNHFRLNKNSKIIAAFVSHSMSLDKNLPVCF